MEHAFISQLCVIPLRRERLVSAKWSALNRPSLLVEHLPTGIALPSAMARLLTTVN